jgi:hypothetical protein
VPVVESNFGTESGGLLFFSQLEKQVEMFLKLACLDHVGVIAPGGPKFVVEKVESVRRLSHLGRLDSTSNNFYFEQIGNLG